MPAYAYSDDVYAQAQAASIASLTLSSLAGLLFIVGAFYQQPLALEIFGSFQLAYFCLASISSTPHPIMSSLSAFSYLSTGYNNLFSNFPQFNWMNINAGDMYLNILGLKTPFVENLNYMLAL
jgi:hypothetical protein